MNTKNIFVFTLTVILFAIYSFVCIADEPIKKELSIDNNTFIRIGMTLKDFERLNCKDLVPVTHIQHKFTDKRIRKFLRFKPPFSVVMKESDLKSYLEFIFNNNQLVEINQYDENGKLQEKINSLHCFGGKDS